MRNAGQYVFLDSQSGDLLPFWVYLVFVMLVKLNKQSEDVALEFRTLWWIFPHHFLPFYRQNDYFKESFLNKCWLQPYFILLFCGQKSLYFSPPECTYLVRGHHKLRKSACRGQLEQIFENSSEHTRVKRVTKPKSEQQMTAALKGGPAL